MEPLARHLLDISPEIANTVKYMLVFQI